LLFNLDSVGGNLRSGTVKQMVASVQKFNFLHYDKHNFFKIYVMKVYILLRKGVLSKCVKSGTCGEKASIYDTPSKPVSM
jgi:hypothetical protein